jgi:hypothetical protein
MVTMSLLDAFATYRAKPVSRVWALSAIADDGSLVVRCSHRNFDHPEQGVLRYADKLSRSPENGRGTELLRKHLEDTLAHERTVRLVIATADKVVPAVPPEEPIKGRTTFHPREDLLGKLVEFDGDRFVIDFRRAASPALVKARGRR